MAVHSNSSVSVAVIGLGAQGLVALKNMLEEGFTVTGFDQNDYIGGIWHYSAQHRVSTLPSTVVNVSRERACFTDFPFPQGTDSFPTASQIDKYLNEYADHFKLRPYLRLSTIIKSVKRDDINAKWVIQFETARVKSDGDAQPQTETTAFDKLIVAVGPHSIPKMPNLPDKDRFQGEILHSINFKNPSDFTGKRVMVVGVGNTAADTATSLVPHASSVILAHRHGAAVLPRIFKNGSSLDHGATYRLFSTKDTLDYYAPAMGRKFMDNWLNNVIKTEWDDYDPQWRLRPVPSLIHQVPTVSDTLIPYLRDGRIISTAAPNRVVGDDSVELEDGTTVKVDAIIYCIGYDPNFSFLGKHDPTIAPYNGDQQSKMLTNVNVRDKATFLATPLLYQNIFSIEYPDSLAFIGLALVSFPAFLTSDLSTMAIAQLWSGKLGSPTLPSKSQIYSWYSNHVLWSQAVRRSSPSNRFPNFHVEGYPWLSWVQNMAGTKVDESLGYLSLEGWRFWWQDHKFCMMLMDGIHSPHLFRVFDSNGRRKSWNGARAAIETVNEDVQKAKTKNAAALKAGTASSIMANRMPMDAVVSA